jgi:hypothetical protein
VELILTTNSGRVAVIFGQHSLAIRPRWTLLAEPALALEEHATGLKSRHFSPGTKLACPCSKHWTSACGAP